MNINSNSGPIDGGGGGSNPFENDASIDVRDFVASVAPGYFKNNHPSEGFDLNRVNSNNWQRYEKGAFYVFFTKPDLNLATWERRDLPVITKFDPSSIASTLADVYKSATGTEGDLSGIDQQATRARKYNVENVPLFKLISQKCPAIIAALTQTATQNGGDSTFFMPALTNLCTGFSSSDISTDAILHTETFTGERMVLAKDSLDSQLSGTITFDFEETADMYISFLFRVWLEYIDRVLKGLVFPKIEYVYGRRIDYAASIYCFAIGPDGETIQFFSKYTGVWPITLPYSAFEERLGEKSFVQQSIGFAYNKKEELIPEIIRDFNAVASEDLMVMINPTGEGSYTASNRYELASSTNFDKFSGADKTDENGAPSSEAIRSRKQTFYGGNMFADAVDENVYSTPDKDSSLFKRVRIVQKPATDLRSTENQLRYCLQLY